jgi:hypothetical protein
MLNTDLTKIMITILEGRGMATCEKRALNVYLKQWGKV